VIKAPPHGSVSLLSGQRLGTVLKSGYRLRYRCFAACTVSATVSVSVAVARRLHISRTLAHGTARRTAAGTGTLTLKLTKPTVERLAHTHLLAATLSWTVTGAGAARAQLAVTLRR
jgi:hypothetical protein